MAAVGRREGSREGRMPRGTSAQSTGRRRGGAGERRRARGRWAAEAGPAGPPRPQGPFCLTKLINTQLHVDEPVCKAMFILLNGK